MGASGPAKAGAKYPKGSKRETLKDWLDAGGVILGGYRNVCGGRPRGANTRNMTAV